MIRYSHVSLIFVCDIASEIDAITTHLEVQPSRVEESKSQSWSKEEGHRERVSWSWKLDSPKNHTDADVPERLWALAEIIEPFGGRLRALNLSHKPWVDVVYHNTPQHPHGVTGEFLWLTMPAETMRRFSAWDLSISYEVFWFDHPDWVQPKAQGWLGRLFRGFRRGGSTLKSDS